MRLSCGQAKKLALLDRGESLPRSQLSKQLINPLQEAGVLQLEKSGASYVIRGVPGKLARFVAQKWGIQDLIRYANTEPENRSRELMADIAGDSKALPNRPFDGIFIRPFDNCFLGDQPLKSSPPGTAILVTKGELPRLRIDCACLIAIENSECLWHFEKVLKFFPELMNKDYALVLRWHWGAAWRLWVKSWQGELLYFPDYDPAGLKIFATEVLPLHPNAELLIPRNIDRLLERLGSRELYLRQEKYLTELKSHNNLAPLCQSLKASRKALEQERLLSETDV